MCVFPNSQTEDGKIQSSSTITNDQNTSDWIVSDDIQLVDASQPFIDTETVSSSDASSSPSSQASFTLETVASPSLLSSIEPSTPYVPDPIDTTERSIDDWLTEHSVDNESNAAVYSILCNSIH